MTDEQLREIVAANSQGIIDLRKTLDQSFKRTNEVIDRTNEVVEQLGKNVEKTDRQVARLGKQIGDIGNKFGRYTEGLFYPSLERILTKDFNLENIAYRYKARRNGDNMELDMLGISNGRENKVVVVEIKSQLRDADINDLVKTLKLFPKFFPEHKNKKLFGIIAAVGINDEQKRRAEKLGIYVVKISDEIFKLISKKDFKPKDFSEAEK